MTKYRILISLTTLTVALDQVSKALILTSYTVGSSTPIIPGYFNITYVQNTGAAFGILATAEPAFRIPFFTFVPLVALFAIGYVFRRLPLNDVKLSTALSLVIGGAVGNLVDRLKWKHVIDFLDFHWKHVYHFPAFNIADSAICIGVAVLLLDLVLGNPDPTVTERPYNASTSV